MHTLDADVAIIGGGGAGTYAALRLQELGLQPLVICKGLVGKSGASIFAGNLNIPGAMLGGTEQNGRDTREFFIKWFNHFLIDQEYAAKASRWVEDVYYPELDELGLALRRDNQGDIVTSISRVRCACARRQGQSGMLLMDIRRKQLMRRAIRALEETAVTALLTDAAGAIAGLVGLHYPSGEIRVVRAPAVVMATGYSDRLAKRSTATREQSADGIALAYRAGAELVNMEIQWWHASDFAHPRTWQRMHVYPNSLVGTTETARMYNADGEQFFELKTDTPVSFAPYVTQLKRLAKQVEAGKARWDGGYTTGYDHIHPEVLEAYSYHAKAFEKLGMSLPEARVETAISWHFRQGGIHVDPHTMKTSVPGLYVAGAVGGHSNGSIGVVSYDGNVAAETIAGERRGDGRTAPEERQVEAEAARLTALLRPLDEGGVTPVHIKNAVRELMWDKMGFVKTEPGMREALAELARIRRDLVPRMGLKNTTRCFNYGWVDAVDVYNMLEVCELTIHSSLNRKESRGPFYRTDHPYTDNADWLAKNILFRDGGGIGFRREPYDLPYLRPEAERSDFFAIDW